MNSSEPSKYTRRPKRLPSLFPWVSPLYFVTFNTHHRTSVLAKIEVHRSFIEFCRKAESFGIRVGNYVIMPNHIHLLVALPEAGGTTLSSWVGSLKNVLGKTLCALQIDKPHWRESFFDHVIRDEGEWENKMTYMRENPVRAELCASPAEWSFQGQICDGLGETRQIQRRRHSAVSTKEKFGG